MVQIMRFLLANDQSDLPVDRKRDNQAFDLSAQQDEDASRNGKQPHDQTQAAKTQAEHCNQPIQDEPDGQ